MYSVDIEILVGGKPIKKFAHKGKTYIQANKESEYSIRLKNNSWKRRMFTVSVDGINVVNGKAAGTSPFGYVINGYASYEVKGFRTNNEEVHPFRFNDKDKSYAAKSEETDGDTSNCGVIGVLVHDEKVKPVVVNINPPSWTWINHNPWNPLYNPSPWWNGDYTRCGNTNSQGVSGCCSLGDTTTSWGSSANATYNCNISNMGGGTTSRTANNSAADTLIRSCGFMSQTASDTTCQDAAFDAGTEFSKESVVDKVTNTTFDVGDLVVSMEFFYAYREGLINMGVPVTKEVKMPSAFPARFCKPPKD